MPEPVILDVLPARTAVISFYYRLGYTEAEPRSAGSPVPLIRMERPITSHDVLLGGGEAASR
jgi:hypothetical protein